MLQLSVQRRVAGRLKVRGVEKLAGKGVEEPRAVRTRGASSSLPTPSSLPQTREIVLEDGKLLCTLYRNVQGQVVLELRSDAPPLREGWVHILAVNQQTKEEALNDFVALEPDAGGMLTKRYILSGVLDPEQAYEVQCEPLPAPHWDVE